MISNLEKESSSTPVASGLPVSFASSLLRTIFASGWFFVIQEVPGEPRFGMDIKYETKLNPDSTPIPNDWDDLAWDRFGAAEPAFVSATPPLPFANPNHAKLDKNVWGRHAADMAFILFQTPVMVAVHASEMLDDTPPPP